MQINKRIVNFNEKQNILRYVSIAGSVNAYFSDDDGKAVALDVHVYKFSASDRPFQQLWNQIYPLGLDDE